jgi:hypothetical protein
MYIGMEKIKVKPEGRKDMWIPEKDSLISYIKAKKLKKIHNFIPTGMMMLGADHDVESVIEDIQRASRMAVFTDSSANMGHSLALIFGDYEKGDKEKLECFDIGKLTEKELQLN